MKVNLNLLPFKIDDYVKIPDEFLENTDIKRLENVHVNGKIDYNVLDDVEINLNVDGTMYLLDAITLDEIKHPFSIEISEILAETEGENEKYYEKSKNILDIIEFLWENIVLEVPIRLTNEKDIHLKGNGWELNKESIDDDIDPRMQKLSEIFKGGE